MYVKKLWSLPAFLEPCMLCCL